MSSAGGRGRRGLVIALLSGQVMAGVDTAIVNVAAPSIRAQLGATDGEIALVVSGYVLVYAVLLQIGARLGDIHGYGKVFRTGLMVFTAASLGCGVAPNTPALIAARLLQGFGAALMVPQVLVGIHRGYSGDARRRALGLYSFALAGSAVLGQVVGGALVTLDVGGIGWRPIFLINVPLGLIALRAARDHLPAFASATRRPTLDLFGAALLSLSLLLVIVPLVFGPELRWPPWTFAVLAAAIPALAAFVVVERRVARRSGMPLLQLAVVTRPAVAWGLAANVAAAAGYFALLFTLALYLQEGMGRSPLYSGLSLIPWVVAFGVLAPPLASALARRTRFTIAWGYLLLAVSLVALSLSVGHGGSHALLLLTLGTGGLGLGVGFAALLSRLTDTVPERHAADVSGLLNTTSQLAGTLGVATFGTAYLTLSESTTAPDAFATVTLTMAVSSLAATICAVLCAGHQSSTGKARPTEGNVASARDRDT